MSAVQPPKSSKTVDGVNVWTGLVPNEAAVDAKDWLFDQASHLAGSGFGQPKARLDGSTAAKRVHIDGSLDTSIPAGNRDAVKGLR